MYIDQFNKENRIRYCMSSSDFDNEDIDFSIIAPDSEKPKAVDFSINSILADTPIQSSPNLVLTVGQGEIDQPQGVEDGSFMRDLCKMEQSLSYESIPYNIYETSDIPAEFTGTNDAKQQSTCTKTLNNMTKGASRVLDGDFRHLILDFKEESDEPYFKLKLNLHNDYYGVDNMLPNQIHNVRPSLKLRSKSKKKNTYKSPKNIFHETSKTKQSTFHSSRSHNRLAEETWVKTHRSKQGSSVEKTKNRKKTLSREISTNKLSKEKTILRKKKPYQSRKKTQPSREIYSEYFGFGEYPSDMMGNRSSISRSKDRSTSRKKKIVFSKKVVQIHK